MPISELESLLNFAYVGKCAFRGVGQPLKMIILTDIMTSETSTITVDKDTLVTMRSVVESLASKLTCAYQIDSTDILVRQEILAMVTALA